MAHQLIENEPRRQSGGRRGCPCCAVSVVVAVVVIALCGGGVWYFFVAMQRMGMNLIGKTTYDLPMDASRFDPWAALPAVTERAGPGARLVGIRASSVRADGTMDLNAGYSPPPSVTYEFVRPAQGKTGPQPPIGAGRRPGDVWIERVTVDCSKPGATMRTRQTGKGGNVTVTYRNRGMLVSVADPAMGALVEALPAPRVGLKEMWRRALAEGRPADAVATVEYDDRGLEFWIPGAGPRLEWGVDGQARD